MAGPTYAELIGDRLNDMPCDFVVGERVVQLFPAELASGWRYRWRNDDKLSARDQVPSFADIREAVTAARQEEAVRLGRQPSAVPVSLMATIPPTWFL